MAKYTDLKRSDGTEIPEDEPYWVFRAEDVLAIPAIWAYREACIRNGLPYDFIREIDKHITLIMNWQLVHGFKMPD